MKPLRFRHDPRNENAVCSNWSAPKREDRFGEECFANMGLDSWGCERNPWDGGQLDDQKAKAKFSKRGYAHVMITVGVSLFC
jgi:hypothetical protein